MSRHPPKCLWSHPFLLLLMSLLWPPFPNPYFLLHRIRFCSPSDPFFWNIFFHQTRVCPAQAASTKSLLTTASRLNSCGRLSRPHLICPFSPPQPSTFNSPSHQICGSQPGASLPPRGHLAKSGDSLDCHDWGGGRRVPPAPSGERTGALLSVQHHQDSPQPITPGMSTGPRLEKPPQIPDPPSRAPRASWPRTLCLYSDHSPTVWNGISLSFNGPSLLYLQIPFLSYFPQF